MVIQVNLNKCERQAFKFPWNHSYYVQCRKSTGTFVVRGIVYDTQLLNYDVPNYNEIMATDEKR